MQIVKLMGGLGNQMFQYAFAKSIGDNVLFDNGWFKHDYNRERKVDFLNLELENFNVNILYASKEQIKDCLNEYWLSGKYNTFRKVIGMNLFNSNRIYEKVRNKYQPNIINTKGNAYYDGYFQNPLYFEKKRSELINEFSPKFEVTYENKKMLDSILNSNSVSVSIRHANDYEKLGWALSQNYYKKTMEYISEMYSDIKFYVFTDNINWCKNNFDNRFNLTYADSNDKNCGYTCGIELMKSCKHNIISNSTYAWWGAWLNDNQEKTVLLPKSWLPQKGLIKVTYDPLYVQGWIAL